MLPCQLLGVRVRPGVIRDELFDDEVGFPFGIAAVVVAAADMMADTGLSATAGPVGGCLA